MPKKLTYEFVKRCFEEEGYTLLSTVYANNRTKLDYICPKGTTHSIVFASWQRGHRCPCCSGCVSPAIGFVRDSFAKEGYTLLSSTYKNAHTKLDFICPNGHKHSINWNSWYNNNQRCFYCTGSIKYTIDEVRASFEKDGYTLVSTVYNGNKGKLRYVCPEGHKGSASFHSWLRGSRCLKCSYIKKAQDNTLSHAFVKTSFESDGYKMVGNYVNAHTPIEYECPYGHRGTIRWANWQQGCRCFTCANIKLSGEGSPHWRGGKSFEEYCAVWKDKEYKQDIKDRDGSVCLNPYCNSKTPEDLTIHHIDYDKKNCHPSNLITVCRSCNSKANTDRTWHKSWYQAIMYRRTQ